MQALLAPLGAFCLGGVGWTLLEYLLHHFVFHGVSATRLGAKEHGKHHAQVDYFAPWWQKTLAALAAFLVQRLCALLGAHASDERLRPRGAGFALAGALVFALHPLQVEPVAFVTGLNALLALVFSVAALLAWAEHARGGGRGPWALSLVFTALALLSKATALCLPPLLLLLHLYLVRRDGVGRSLRALAPHFAVALACLALHALLAERAGAVGAAISPGVLLTRLPRLLFVPEFYVLKFLWPLDLTIEYDFEPFRRNRLAVLAAAAGLGLVLGLLVIRGHRERTLGWLLAWSYAVAVLPVTNVFNDYQIVGDRYAQLPLLWLTPLILLAPARLLPGRPAALAAALLATALFAMSFRQVGVWKDEETLYRHAIAVHPRAVKALVNLGLDLSDAGRDQEALALLERVYELHEDLYYYDYHLGRMALREGNLPEAEKRLLAAAAKRGHSRHIVFWRLGEVYDAMGDRRRALDAYAQARREYPAFLRHSGD